MVVKFRRFFLGIVCFCFCFFSVFAVEEHLEVVRDSILDVMEDVQLFETVLFDAGEYFQFGNESNNNVEVVRSAQIDINVSGKGGVERSRGGVGGGDETFFNSDGVLNIKEYRRSRIPNQLFDISFTLVDQRVRTVDELVSIVTFDNFGTEPIPVSLSFVFYEESGSPVLNFEDGLTVESSEAMFYDFGKLPKTDLIDGTYKVVLTTSYGDGVVDDFEAEFFIENKVDGMVWVSYILFGGLGFVVFIFIVFGVSRFFGNNGEEEDEGSEGGQIGGVSGPVQNPNVGVVQGDGGEVSVEGVVEDFGEVSDKKIGGEGEELGGEEEYIEDL